MADVEGRIAEWRSYVAQGNGVADRDVDELEDHLRDQIADLSTAGLDADEAFLIAVKRMGRLDELSHEYALEHSDRLWKQLVVPGAWEEQESAQGWIWALVFAVGAAVTIQIARLAAGLPVDGSTWLLRNVSLFVLPFLAAYFAQRRRLTTRQSLLTGLPFLAAAIVINVYPYAVGGATELLVAAHLPVVLWFVVAFPYMSGALGSHERRMDFVRFTGEWFIYYVLIALGGGVLMMLTTLVLEPTGVDPDRILEWVLPSGAAGAVVVAAWLVESKQRVIENMAPVLTMVFTPLFAVMLTVAAVAYIVTGLGGVFDRELLGVFDALLVVVLGLVIYGISARDPSSPAGWLDRAQSVTVFSALFLDMVALIVMIARIGDLGFTPNRAAALGLNIVLLVNLTGTAWLSTRFLAGRGTFRRVEHWQTSYLPVFAIWAAIVVVVLPPLFAFA